MRLPRTIYVALAVVLLAAAVLSFDVLRGLALAVSIPKHFAWLLPIAVDAGAAVSCAVWLGGRADEHAARFAGRMTWALLAVTVAGNAGQLGMHAHGITPPWWVAVLVGTIPPAVVGCSVHLVVLLVRRTTVVDEPLADPVRPAPDPVRPAAAVLPPPPAVEAGPVPADPTPPAPGRTDPATRPAGPDPAPEGETDDPDREIVDRLAAWTAREGSVPSRERVRQEYGIGSRRADRVRAAVRTTSDLQESA